MSRTDLTEGQRRTVRRSQPTEREHMRIRTAAAAAVTAIAAAAGIAAAPAAHAAATATVTAVTHVADRPDGGHGGTWAYDTFDRTLTVTQAADQSAAPAGDTLYDATITDKGTFSAVVGSLAPNQATAGVKVAHAVKGTVAGSYTLTVTAPSGDALTGTVPATEDDNFAAPKVTTGDWPKQAFATAAGVTVTGGAYSWTYATACEKWTDSSTNGDGNQAADGNITGKVCAVPVLSHGQGVYWAPTREQVGYQQSLASWDEFTIVGPGAINGHQGWVNGIQGANTGYYWGLLPHHGYTVFYQPVTGQGSTVPVPGSHWGYVYFVTDVPPAS